MTRRAPMVETLHPALAQLAVEHGVLLLPMEPQPELIKDRYGTRWVLAMPDGGILKWRPGKEADAEIHLHAPHQPGDTIAIRWTETAASGPGTEPPGLDGLQRIGVALKQDERMGFFGPVARVEPVRWSELVANAPCGDQGEGAATVIWLEQKAAIESAYPDGVPEHLWRLTAEGRK